MTEELDLTGLLAHFPEGKFQRGERIILGTYGTNQAMLTLIFGKPNKVKLIDQGVKDGVIQRVVDLVLPDGTPICRAVSKVPVDKNIDGVVTDVINGKFGLGQIAFKHNIPNVRNLVSVGTDGASFWRTYTMEGRGLYMVITETFYREQYRKIGWVE